MTDRSIAEPVSGFRQYLDRLDDHDDLNRIHTPISWDLEASAVTMLANRRDDKIPVFETVEDSGVDARLVGDPYRGSRKCSWDHIAIALGLPADLSADSYYEEIIDRLQHPIESKVVDREDAACKSVIHRGDDADLLTFPWPYIHAGDGGRYSNLHTMVVDDPDSTWTDWSAHRAMIHDSDRASLLLLAGEQTPNIYYYKHERRDEPMPVALVVGGEPVTQMTSSMWIPTGRDEAAFAGGLKGDPVELVECETNDLKVPATAEVVIEGQIKPNERLDEGPFGDYFGYMHGPRRSMPALQVDAITHRKQPYIPFCVEGSGVGHTLNTSASTEVACVGPDATLGLRKAGYDVEKCVPWRFTPRTVYVISTDISHSGYLHELANFIFTTWGMLHIDAFIFVDEEVDALDTRAVLESVALHADPDQDFHQFGVETMPKVPLNIYQTPEEKGNAETGTSKAKTSKAYIDATSEGEGRPDWGSEKIREEARDILRRADVDFDITETEA